MALTEEKIVDQIEVVGEHKIIQVRTKTVIAKDGDVIATSYHRHIVTPESDLTGESEDVKAIAKAVHTGEVKSAFMAENE